MSRLSVLVVACVLGLGARAQVNREIDRSEDLLAVDSFDNEVSFCILYSFIGLKHFQRLNFSDHCCQAKLQKGRKR